MLATDLDAAQAKVSTTSLDLLQAATHTATSNGQDKIRELMTARRSDRSDWKQVANVLTHVCGWAVTCQSARRFPPRPALFNLVVIDEASQCSIPHVVPLLFRARRALIVGDVMQLPHISGLSPRQDRELRNRHAIGSAWAEEHCQSVRRHSAFHAAQRAVSGSLLLDEHYRSHPEIAALANRLFYGGELTVLTEIRGRPALTGRCIRWHNVTGRAIRGPNGGSWRNPEETTQTIECVKHLLGQLPPEATIGVVTPYAAQSTDLRQQLGVGTDQPGGRVRVGTVHTFQGGECDVMVLNLVAGRNVPPRCFDWIDQQPQLWNVAITRARSNLIVVGDRELWLRRGGVGAELAAASKTAPDEHGLDEALRTRFYNHLEHDDPAVQLGVVVNGHLADAQLSDGSAVLLDPGTANRRDPAVHLEQMLRRRRLLAGPDTQAARRIPAWTVYEDGI